MNNALNSAIQSVLQSEAAWCRFITGNDTGLTGSHQSGFYVPKYASPLLFSEPGQKGENKEKTVLIKWQDDFTTESRMKYYGQGTRNEYRITRFGRNFPFFEDNNVGDLLVIAKHNEEEYSGYVLSSDDDIDGFFAFFNLSPSDLDHLIDSDSVAHPDKRLEILFDEFISQYSKFPDTKTMSLGARACYNKAYRVTQTQLMGHPDEFLLSWIDTEYSLFKEMEKKLYADMLSNHFGTVEEFIQAANEVLNRRKSRAGKSLEYHLADIFTNNSLAFEEQAITEDNKKPDFIFPNGVSYHNLHFPAERLIVLGAKTTCKDRWRQVLTEADRVDRKYLFTLQQGISKNQLKEMFDSKLTLIVPQKHLSSFPKEYQESIMNLNSFIGYVKENQVKILAQQNP